MVRHIRSLPIYNDSFIRCGHHLSLSISKGTSFITWKRTTVATPNKKALYIGKERQCDKAIRQKKAIYTWKWFIWNILKKRNVTYRNVYFQFLNEEENRTQLGFSAHSKTGVKWTPLSTHLSNILLTLDTFWATLYQHFTPLSTHNVQFSTHFSYIHLHNTHANCWYWRIYVC